MHLPFGCASELDSFIDDVAYCFGLWQFPEQDDVDFAIPELPKWAPPSKPEYLIEPKVTTDEDRWLEALTVERHYGDDAICHANGRIMEREDIGDLWGAARWRDIRFRLEALEYAHALQRARPRTAA